MLLGVRQGCPWGHEAVVGRWSVGCQWLPHPCLPDLKALCFSRVLLDFVADVQLILH